MSDACPTCGLERRVVRVAVRFDVAVCPASPQHCDVVLDRGGKADWAEEDRWWRSLAWDDKGGSNGTAADRRPTAGAGVAGVGGVRGAGVPG